MAKKRRGGSSRSTGKVVSSASQSAGSRVQAARADAAARREAAARRVAAQQAAELRRSEAIERKRRELLRSAARNIDEAGGALSRSARSSKVAAASQSRVRDGQPLKRLDRPEVKREPNKPRPESQAGRRLDLDERPICKARPLDSRVKSGSGPSREFIPWCDARKRR